MHKQLKESTMEAMAMMMLGTSAVITECRNILRHDETASAFRLSWHY